jgi:hypothetical protein
MIPGVLNFIVYQGSTFGPAILTGYSDLAHTIPANLTGFLPHARVRKTPNSPVILDLLPFISNGVGGEVTIPAVTDENTARLPRGNYIWDLLLERSTGEVLGPFLAGSFIIGTAVSRA